MWMKYKPSLNNYVLFLAILSGMFFFDSFRTLKTSENSALNSTYPEISLNPSNDSILSDYLLGSGDVLFIYFSGVEIFTRSYGIDPEGKLNMPEIGEVYVEGMTIKELKNLLQKEYKDVLIEPSIKVSIQDYRPVTFYLGGEIKSPGLYTLESIRFGTNRNISTSQSSIKTYKPLSSHTVPKLFDALKLGKGITNYADLKNIKIIRENSKSQGGGKIETSINIIELLENGNQKGNIRILDGDAIFIPKSEKLLVQQLLEIKRTNLTPDQINVFITGNVFIPGSKVIRQGSSLVQAISVSGGEGYFTGRVKLIRFNNDGLSEKRSFNYDPNAEVDSYKNPILVDGDIIHVNKSIAGKTAQAIKEFSQPILGAYTLYNIFGD